MKKVGIIQSSYIPWKGYFDIIHDVDLFVYLDDVQYTSRDWRNRNKIKTSQLLLVGGDLTDDLLRESFRRLVHGLPARDEVVLVLVEVQVLDDFVLRHVGRPSP